MTARPRPRPPILLPPPPSLPPPQIEAIGKEEPLSEEKLSPLLAMYRASSFESAVAKADRLVGPQAGCTPFCGSQQRWLAGPCLLSSWRECNGVQRRAAGWASRSAPLSLLRHPPATPHRLPLRPSSH